MRKNNKKWFTLIEMIVYTWILIIGSIFVITVFFWGVKQFENSTLNTEEIHNIANAQIFLKKALENIDNVVLLRHKAVNSNIITWDVDINIDGTIFNKKQFLISDIISKCWFIVNDDYDLIAYSSKDNLDPIIIWVIWDTTKTSRPYHQLAIYKYYSTTSEKAKILWDKNAWRISSYINSKWNYETEWLTSYKCNKNNWFLLPISNKFYPDMENNFKYTSYLKRFKVISTGINDNNKYWNWLTEIQLEWESINNTIARTKYQYFSKIYSQ